MSEHVPNDLLHAFVEGDVEEQLAIHIAEHLDQCPHCATRSATLEPLASAFASCDDPVVPEHLATAVLEELARQPHGRAVPEVAVGAGLLVLAAALAAATQHPVTLLADVGSMISAASAVVRSAALGLTPYALASSATMVAAGLGAAFTLRIAQAPHLLSGASPTERSS
jgi:anti-sigma factor RsiW